MAIVRTNDANNANTNRHVRFLVQAEDAGEQVADLFVALKGPQNAYPYYGQIRDPAPTLDQELAQLRLSLVTRVLTRWAILVGVQVADDAAANAGGGLILTYEQDEMGVFYNNAWGTNPGGVDKHSPSGTLPDITADQIQDTVGIGGLVTGPKEKPGLNALLDDLAGVSYDGGTTSPFGALSATGNITLPDGRVTAGSPTLSAGGTVSGLEVVYLAQ